MDTYRSAVTTCVRCHKAIDAHSISAGSKHGPSAGDISLCAYCGFIGIYDDVGAIQAVAVNVLIEHLPPEQLQGLMMTALHVYYEWVAKRTEH